MIKHTNAGEHDGRPNITNEDAAAWYRVESRPEPHDPEDELAHYRVKLALRAHGERALTKALVEGEQSPVSTTYGIGSIIERVERG